MEHQHEIPAALAGDGFFSNLLKVYVPRYQCMYHESGLIWLHLVSDFVIAAAYYSIPVALVYFARRRRDLAFNWMFLLFALFIVLCGTTHIFDIVAVWRPLYRLDGLLKAGTALASIATAVLLWSLMPAALSLPGIADIKRRRDELEALVVARTSELQVANEELRVAKEKAEAANTAKSDFLANMSHEIRTPMNAIAGLTDLLRRGDVPREKQTLFLNTMGTSMEQLMRLVNDLLDIAKIEANSIEIENAPFRLSVLVEEVAALGRIQAARKGIDLSIEDHRGANIHVVGDAVRLRQILTNIVDNAVKFTEKGEVKIKAECRMRPDRDAPPPGRTVADIHISVADTGIGIPADKIDTIFGKFVQADTAITRKYGGTGLGLSIAKTLAELMGGTVTARSVPGEGATFTIGLTLPVREDAVFHASVHEKAQARGAPPAPRRVLLVEDNEANLLLATAALDTFGDTYAIARNGREALDMLAHATFDAVLMDVQMPLMDGVTATRQLRAREKETGTRRTPVIGVTAHALKGDREKCLAAGMDEYLSKPFKARDLKDALEAVCGG